jgi:serine/threonine protein kinase/predicted Zn-dependent protease
MGLVFSAWDARLQRDVAIKLLREEYSSPDMRTRFLQEARAASGLNHPHICTIFDIGEQAGDPYLVMELLKGETLRARITSGTISSEDIARVGSEVADALAVAHTRGIIHRDIKPANIILVDKPGGKFGTKVLDFGLAKVEMGDGHERFDLTSIGSTVGTVAYMSPEQARGEPLDARSDLFSLGVVLYEMATGDVPFRGATSALVFVQLLSAAPEPVRELNASIPKELERVILKLLEKDRSQRFQSAAEVVDAIHQLPARGSTPGKSIWGAIPSLGRPRGDASAAREVAAEAPPQARRPAGETDRSPSPPPVSASPPSQPSRPAPMGESVLRPVRRIVTSDPEVPVSAPSRPRITSESPIASPAFPPASERPEAESPSSAGIKAKSDSKVPRIDASARLSRPSTPSISLTPVPRSSSQKLPAPRFQRLDDQEELTPPRSPSTPSAALGPSVARRTYPWLLAAIVVVVIGVAAWLFWPKQGTTAPNASTMIVLAPMTNHTADVPLSGVLVAGLQFGLEQSTRFDVLDSSALMGSLHALDLQTPSDQPPGLAEARQAAQAIGANAVLFGDLRPNGPSGYTVEFKVYDVATGAESVNVTDNSASVEQLPDTIDRLVSEVRSGLGESGDSIGKTSIPLSKEASSIPEALQDYVTGRQLMNSGQPDAYIDAMHAFEQATTQDPHFSQAYVKLADLYRRQHASVAAAKAAKLAQTSSQAASPRTQLMAQASYELDATGDYPKAANLLQQLLTSYPGDAEATNQLATIDRLEGKFPESLELSEKILQKNPYDLDASAAAEMAMLAQDPPDRAEQLERQVQRSGHSHPGLRVLINYLSSRDNGQVAVDLSNEPDRFSASQYQAAVYDADGLLSAGLSTWRALAGRAAGSPELTSAAGEALATAALDRAMVEDCPTATGLLREAGAYPQGLAGLFEMGLTAGLCGNLDLAKQKLAAIQTGYPQSFAAKGFYYPDLQAVIQWKGGDSSGALKTLLAAGPFDRISLTPYLRAQIHLKSGEPQDLKSAIVDFQAILGRWGATTLANPVMYPTAQIGLARAYRMSGDSRNSATAYRDFLKLWSAPDTGQPMVKEARSFAQ